MSVNRLLLAMCLLVLVGCQKPANDAPPGALKRLVESVKSLSPCSRRIPMEWATSWPVPLKNQDHEFKIFFFPVGHKSSTVQVKEPMGSATFDIISNKVLSCDARTDRPRTLSSQRWPDNVSNLSIDEFDSKAEQLFNATQKIGSIYGRNSSRIAAVDQAAVKNFFLLFKALAEPDLLSYYYRANPDFWEWLRAQNGDSLSAPR